LSSVNEERQPDVLHHHVHFTGTPVGGDGGSQSTVSQASGAPFHDAPPQVTTLRPIRYWDSPPWEWLVYAVLAALAVLAVIWFASLIHFGHSHHAKAAPAAVGLTMPQILASEGFNTDHHAICSWQDVSNGTAYKVFLNAGNSCRSTIQAIIPANKDYAFNGHSFRRLSATFVYNGATYTPAQAKKIKQQMSLGEQVTLGLRNIVVRSRTT
jgi:hypothetical protein